MNNHTSYRFIYKKLFQQIFDLIISKLKIKFDNEVSLIIVDNQEMQTISKKYKKIDKSTDVLSFPTNYHDLVDLVGYNILGDIFISYEKVIYQSKEYNHSTRREWSYLFAHGLLHLLGYDHLTLEDEKIMHKLIEEVLNQLEVRR